MTTRNAAWLILMTVTGILSAAVTLYGIFSALVVDLRVDTVLIGLYCLLPIPAFPVFMLVRPQRRSTVLLFALAIAYLIVFSVVNRRSCIELGYCGSFASTLFQTMFLRPVLIYFASAVLSFIAMMTDREASGMRPMPPLSQEPD
ncbi:MAG TPA: hypothetical protein VKR52_02335 [Terracidiphilus sp.]|nr:hypothetical protein [Terracidiphilus sp.]